MINKTFLLVAISSIILLGCQPKNDITKDIGALNKAVDAFAEGQLSKGLEYCDELKVRNSLCYYTYAVLAQRSGTPFKKKICDKIIVGSAEHINLSYLLKTERALVINNSLILYDTGENETMGDFLKKDRDLERQHKDACHELAKNATINLRA